MRKYRFFLVIDKTHVWSLSFDKNIREWRRRPLQFYTSTFFSLIVEELSSLFLAHGNQKSAFHLPLPLLLLIRCRLLLLLRKRRKRRRNLICLFFFNYLTGNISSVLFWENRWQNSHWLNLKYSQLTVTGRVAILAETRGIFQNGLCFQTYECFCFAFVTWVGIFVTWVGVFVTWVGVRRKWAGKDAVIELAEYGNEQGPLTNYQR